MKKIDSPFVRLLVGGFLTLLLIALIVWRMSCSYGEGVEDGQRNTQEAYEMLDRLRSSPECQPKECPPAPVCPACPACGTKTPLPEREGTR